MPQQGLKNRMTLCSIVLKNVYANQCLPLWIITQRRRKMGKENNLPSEILKVKGICQIGIWKAKLSINGTEREKKSEVLFALEGKVLRIKKSEGSALLPWFWQVFFMSRKTWIYRIFLSVGEDAHLQCFFFYYDQCVSIILGLKILQKGKQLAYRRNKNNQRYLSLL